MTDPITQDTASSDQAQITVAEEDDFNTPPASKDGDILRHTGFELSLSTETQSSEEINDDRQQSDTTRVGFNTDGPMGYELSFGTYDRIFEHALFNEFEFAHTISGTLGTDSANDQITSDTSGSGPDLSRVLPGQEIDISGFSSSIDGTYTVQSVDTSSTVHTITVEETIGSDITGDADEEIAYNFQTGTLSADANNDQFNVDTTVTGAPTFDGYEYGMFIKIDGFSNSENNGYFYITGVDTSSDTHKITVRGGISNDETAVSGVKIGTRRLQNGTNIKSLYFEKDYQDLTGDTITGYPGVRTAQWEHSIEQQANVTGSFTFQGMDENPNKATTELNGSPRPANTNEIFSSADNVPRFLMNGSEQPIQSFSHSMDNGPRIQNIVGQAQPLNINAGQIGLTGDVAIYTNDPSIYKNYTDFEDSSFGVVQEDSEGNAYAFGYEFVNFGDGDENPDSPDSDIMTNLSWEASKDDEDETGKMIQVFKFPGDVI